MRNLKLIVFSLVVFCLQTTTSAQDGPFGYYNDALLFSRTTFGGTARIQGIGGAQVSLGGDQSSAGSNPAGLGFFNRSTFVITPALSFHNSDAEFQGESSSSFLTRFNLPQLGVVLNYSKPNTTENAFRGGSFGITINRTNNFNSEVQYVGFNDNNSIVDSFIQNAGTADPGDLGGFEGIAYDHFLIDLADYDSDIDYFIDDDGIIVPNDGDGSLEGYGSLLGAFGGSLPRQTETIRTRGGQNQINLAWGGNLQDRLYFGAGLGIATINFERERTYIEDQFAFDDGSIDDVLNSIVIDDELRVSGAGVNASLGVIARPIDFLTVGVSYVSPTFYGIEEESFFTFITNWNSFYSYGLPADTVGLDQIITDSDISISNYSLRTPAKLNVGTTFFLGKQGFISGDVEFVDYSSAELRSNDFRERADNQEISDLYRNTVNFRLGAEFRLDQFRLRGGYAYQADPYKDSDFDRSIQDLSFGLGFRTKDYFVDLAIINRRSDNVFSPYFVAENQPVAEAENSTTTASISVGFTF